MFKQIRFFRISASSFPSAAALESALEKTRFKPCAPTEKKSLGWVPPRGNKYDPLIETVDGQWILRLQVEKKAVPAATLRDAVEKRCQKIESEQGRKPGRKEKRELKELCELELLPRAFSKIGATTIWIDRAAQMLVIGTTSQTACDDIVSQLIADLSPVIKDVSVTLADTNNSPSAAMTAWLLDYAAPGEFELDRTLELQAADESKATVKYNRHNLDVGAVRDQLQSGLVPKSLALSWNNEINLVLGADLTLKKLELVDLAQNGAADADSQVDSFDADVTIMTGTLRALLPAVAQALGGFSSPTATV